jgi:chromosome segregation ATPase
MLEALLVSLVFAVAAIAALVSRARGQSSRADGLARELEGLRTRVRELEADHKKAAKDLDERRADATEAKNELAAQRKKTHAAQEETKKVREELKEAKRAAELARESRPAFESAPPPPPKAAPKPVVVEVAPAAPAKPSVDHDAKIEQLQNRLTDIEAALSSERTAHAADSADLKRLRRRVENFRRVDVVTKGQTEALQERLRHLGRQYYDAVSELAHLKGEIPPPPPPPEAQEPAAPSSEASSDDETETAGDAAP